MGNPNYSADRNRKVLLVGWDAADWQVIAPLLDDGKMPHLEGLINRGVMGNLATIYPVLSPMLWTSISTGKRAWKHGIHGFTEPDPHSGSIRPISNLARKCKSIWNILNQSGLRSNVVGWWPSQPVEPINGVMVSDLYKRPSQSREHGWPMRPGTVHPARLEQPLSKLRIHPLELDGESLLPFVPKASEIDQQKDQRLMGVAKCLAECSTVHAAATAIMQLEPWDFMAVYYDAIDHFSHTFMRYHPPRLDWVNEQDFEHYKDVVSGAYRYHDMMLGVLLELAGDDTTVILMSDHGFHSDHLRPQILPDEPAGPAEEHRPYGIVVMAGPGIKQDELVFGSTLMDITPTILTLFDLPVGRDMDGRPLATAFEQPPAAKWVDSWEDISGDDGRHPADFQLNPVESQEALKQLVDLGYIEPPNDNADVAVKECLREQQYNLARAYHSASRIPEALSILEELWETWPGEHRFGVLVFKSCLELKRTVRARGVLEQVLRNKRNAAEQALAELKKLSEQWETAGRKPDELDVAEQFRVKKLQRQASTDPFTMQFLEGSLLSAEGRFNEALRCFENARGTQTHNRPDLCRVVGQTFVSLNRWSDAEQEFLALRELDPTNPAAPIGLAQCNLRHRRFDAALQESTMAAGLLYHQPQAHFLAGLALMGLKRFTEAAAALETAVNQNPVFPQAHRRLARLYFGPLNDHDKARQHRDLEHQSLARIEAFMSGELIPEMHDGEWVTRELIAGEMATGEMATLGDLGDASPSLGPISDDTVVVVSGLPRSGTSMMMQMLAAAGMPVFVDDHRPSDESNPRGYFEHESARRLASDQAWIDEAGGTAVKIVAQLLPHLPQAMSYRIIFMERPLAEVVASQRKMLTRLQRDGGKLSDEQLARTYIKQIAAVKNVLRSYGHQVSLISVDYADTLADPESTSTRVNRFLGGGLSVAEMVSSIDPSLRNEFNGRRHP